MAEDKVLVGSRLRVWLPTVDATEEGDEEFDPAELEVVVSFAGTAKDVGELGEEGGVPYIDFAEGELDSSGVWTINANADGYKARMTFRVYR